MVLLSYGSMFTNNVRICIYVCMYVCMYVCIYVIYFLQFMVISIILTRVFYFMCLKGVDLISAAWKGYVAAVKRILSARPDLINYRDEVGRAMEKSVTFIHVLVCIHACFIRSYSLSPIVPIYLLPPISVAKVLVAHMHLHIHCILIRYSIIHCMYGRWLSVYRVSYLSHSSRTSLAVSSASYSVSPPAGDGTWSPICQRT